MADEPHAFPGRDASGRWTAGSDGSGWTPHRIDRLLALAAQGLSSSLIAAELGGVTRNAVVGKLNRLRQRLEVNTETREVRTPKTRKPRKRRSPPVKPEPELELETDDAPVLEAEPEPWPSHMDEPLPSSRLIPNGEQRYHHCRWPLGDPRTPEFRYCGADREHDRTPYCLTHHQLARS